MSALANLRQKRDDLTNQIKEAFLKACQEFFDGNPNVHIIWTQYAPYFNDGDPCYFSVHEPDIYVLGEDEDIGECDYEWGHDDSEKLEGDAKAQVRELVAFIQGEQDLMERMYGDGFKVVLGKGGANVTAYDHD